MPPFLTLIPRPPPPPPPPPFLRLLSLFLSLLPSLLLRRLHSSLGGGCRGLIKNSADDELPEDVGLPSLFSLFRSRLTSLSLSFSPFWFIHSLARTFSFSPYPIPSFFLSRSTFSPSFVAFLPSLPVVGHATADPFHFFYFFFAAPRGAAARFTSSTGCPLHRDAS